MCSSSTSIGATLHGRGTIAASHHEDSETFSLLLTIAPSAVSAVPLPLVKLCFHFFGFFFPSLSGSQSGDFAIISRYT